jgi:peptide-methionine (R)-S-oxide reductase
MYKIMCCFLLLSQGACSQGPTNGTLKKSTMSEMKNKYYSTTSKEKLVLADSVWKQVLSPEVYQIAREKGTERPFSSAFETSKEVGTFH